jgi:hypothetical protein
MREALRSLRHVAMKRLGRRGGRFCSCSEDGEDELSESMMPPRIAIPMVPVKTLALSGVLFAVFGLTTSYDSQSEAIV